MRWKRPSGSEITTNNLEGSIKQGLAMGWEMLEELPVVDESNPEIPTITTNIVDVDPVKLNIVDKPVGKSPPELEVFPSPDGTFSAEYDGQMLNFPTRAEAEEAVEKEVERLAALEADDDDEMTA